MTRGVARARLHAAALLATALLTGTPARAQPLVRWTPAPPAVARTGIALPVGKCLNYAGQLEVERDESWMRPVVPGDFGEMRAEGFRTIRVPLNLSRFAAHAPPYTIDPAYVRRIRQVVTLASAAGLNVILDDHLHAEMFADPEAERDRFVGLWRQMGRLFRAAPGSVWFELLNEPHGPLTNARLPTFYRPVLAAIRESNPVRPVIIGGDWYNALGSLDTLDMLDDAHVVPTFHFYEPMAFTHQGATWVDPPLPKGVRFGSAADHAAIDRAVTAAKAYMARTGRVPFIGEYGAVESIPAAERATYYAEVTRAFASVGIQSCVWGYVNNFPIRDRHGWNRRIVNAIATVSEAQINR